MKVVSKEEFMEFLKNYPRPLEADHYMDHFMILLWVIGPKVWLP